jgi:hypothetical protein
MVRGLLAPYLETGTFGSLEVHAVERIASACSTTIGHFDALTIAAAVWATQQGHVCFDLGDASLLDDLAVARRPDVDSWFAYLEGSLLVHRAATWGDLPDPARPLVMYGSRIYLARQWIDEGVVAHSLARRRGLLTQPMETSIVDSLFAPVDRGEPQYQAVVRSLEARTSIVTGGPGTGKTYTGVALAVKALKEKQVKRIILTRPAVEAGENLGFLPGDMKEKLDPYMQPLYDALRDMLPPQTLEDYILKGIIQIAPLAFMRGRTLDNAFVILDEAQNTTHSQMKMFLTRMGKHAKFVITGDPGQVDLPRRTISGLKEALLILKDVEGVGIIYLDDKDIVRHKLVKKIIDAYKSIENHD